MNNLIADLNLITKPLPTIGGPGLGGFSQVSLSPGDNAATIISMVLGFLTIVGGLWFLANFIIGAVSWISAGGDKGKTTQAKDKITNAVLGLAIVVGAYAISGLLGSILGLDFLNLGAALKTISPNTGPTAYPTGPHFGP